jgi:hypothetical protein
LYSFDHDFLSFDNCLGSMGYLSLFFNTFDKIFGTPLSAVAFGCGRCGERGGQNHRRTLGGGSGNLTC